jgi:hypothetical protein
MFADYSEKQFVISQITRALVLEEYPRQKLISPFIGSNFPMKLGQGTAATLAIQAVNICVEDAYNNDPTWLYLLLNNFAVFDARIKEIIERIPNYKSVAVDPLDEVVLNNEIPFVNRRDFRNHIVRLASSQANNKPILVITGECKTGKSYSINFIEHFSNRRSTILSHRVEFDPELAADMGAEQIAQKLVGMMGRNFDNKPAPNTNNKLYVQKLADWVLSEALQTEWQNWFILDNFNGKNLRQDVRDLIVALSSQVTTGLPTQRCRLFLIGFDRANLTVEPAKVAEDIVTKMKRADLDIVIVEIAGRAATPVDKQHLDEFVLTNLPNGENKLSELNIRLRILIFTISRLNKILENLTDINYEKIFLEMIANLPSGEDGLKEVKQRINFLSEGSQDVYV